ncbi:MAG: radical SAM protein [Candidatus Diapherotrites archaeon]|nr:radical SAM protein [Candidatus Diapherotrites archaeon]
MINFYYDFFKNEKRNLNTKNKISQKTIAEISSFKFKPSQGLRIVKKTEKSVFIHAFLLNRVYFIEKNIFEKIQSFSGTINSQLEYNLLKFGLLEEENHSFDFNCKNNKLTNLAIFPTTSCNLNCVYCYANAGVKQDTIDMNFVKSGIDWFTDQNNNSKTLDITFHGGGEPTNAMDIIEKTLEYARSKVNTINASASSNGVFSEKTLEYIIENFNNITLSCDGPPDIQNKQRPQRNNQKSSEIIERTIDRFIESGFDFSVRSTITDYSCEKQNRIVEYFHKKGCNNMHFEPMFENKKSLSYNADYAQSSNSDKFVKNFLIAKELSEEYGQYLHCSYLPVGKVTNKFCKACGENFSLTPDGFISSCFEAINGTDHKTNKLIYGHFDKTKKSIIINEKKLLALKNRKLENMPNCNPCEFKYGCGGFCLSKTLYGTGKLNAPDPNICKIITCLGTNYLEYFFNKKIQNFVPHIIEGKEKQYQLSTHKTKILEFNNACVTKNTKTNPPILSINFNDLVSQNTLKKIIDINPHTLIVFVPDFTIFNKEKYALFEKTKQQLNKNQIQIKLTKQLPYCITNEKNSKIPCITCFELFKSKPNGTIIFCDALQIKPQKITNFETRADFEKLISRQFKCIGEKQDICSTCIYLLRGNCGGKCKKINVDAY